MASDTSLVFNLIARDRASEEVGKVGEHIKTAAAGIGMAAAGALGAGLLQAMDASAANAKLAAQLGVGPAEAAELSKVSATVYANAWGDSVATVNEAIKGVYQNIGDTSKAQGGLEGVTTKVLALSQTFDAELGMTTAAVGQLMRTGLAKDADQALDIVAKGLGSGADKAGDFLETLNEYSTQWRRVGLDGQTATGLLAQGLKAGARDADQVADAIGQFGERALAGGTAVDAAYKSIGLNAGTMATMIGKGGQTANEALTMTLNSLRGTKDEQVKLNAAAALFGDPGNVLGDALFALDPATAAAASGMDNVSGAAEKVAKTVSESPVAALERFKRQAITQLAEVAGTFASFAMKNQAVMQPVLIGLGALAGTILVIRGAMAAWTAIQALWTAATTLATGAQWLLNSALLANPFGLIIIAIVAMVAAIVMLWQRNQAFRNFVVSAWNAIWGAIKNVWGWIKNNWPMLLAILTGPIGIAAAVIMKHGNRIMGFIRGLPGRIAGVASRMWNSIPANFRNALNSVIGAWNRLSFHIGGGSFLGASVPSFTLNTPNVPYLASGGLITGAGSAIVGERGPELVSLPRGASVQPLARGGTQQVVVTFDFRSAGRSALKEFISEIVRVDGQGSVQKAFGS